MSVTDFDYLINLKDACKLFNQSETTLKRNIKSGKFKENIDYKLVSGRFFFSENNLCELKNLIDETYIANELGISKTLIKTLRKRYLIENTDYKYFNKTIVYSLKSLDKLKEANENYWDEELLKKHSKFIGEKINLLTILDVKSMKTNLHPSKTAHYFCECECGNKKWIPCCNIKSNEVKSCGCLFEKAKKDLEAITIKNLEKIIIDNVNINAINRDKPYKSNTSGVTGVKFDKDRNKWVAEIKFQKKYYYLGRYDKKKDAIKVRKEAEEKFHKKFLREKGLIE